MFNGSNVMMMTNVASTGFVGYVRATSSNLSNPVGVCWAPSSNQLYVTNMGSEYLTVFDLNFSVVTSFPMPSTPSYLVYHEPTDRIYATCQGGAIVIVNPNTNTIVGSIGRSSVQDGVTTVAREITGIASIPQTNQLVVSGQSASNIAVFDAPRDARFMY